MSTLAAAIVDALREDPAALACLRELIGSPPPAPEETPWYTVRSLAAALGVSEKVIRNAIARGELRGAKRGGRWYLNQEDVEHWLQIEKRPPGGTLGTAFAAYEKRAA